MIAGLLIVVAAAALVAVFARLNWPVIVAEAPISVGVAQVHAPLGLILLAALVLVAVVAVVMLIVQQARTLQELRRSEKALKSQRELADKAEASRFVGLQQHLDESFAKWQASLTESLTAQDLKQASSEQRLLLRMDEDGRTLSAMLGEIEDKLDRHLERRAGSVSDAG